MVSSAKEIFAYISFSIFLNYFSIRLEWCPHIFENVVSFDIANNVNVCHKNHWDIFS